MFYALNLIRIKRCINILSLHKKYKSHLIYLSKTKIKICS